ncbi:MAG: formylglycine-generating enzyme family protein [Nitrospinae bacterium]|nr:formylglycine-generating enzyme family protein [Nitrospinota bacterium]
MEKKDAAPFRHWRLAAQSLLDIHKDNRDADVVRLARQRLQFILTAKETPKIKAEAGEILGWLGDPRGDLEELVRIKGGEYELEDLGKANLKPFGIGKYPVANQWFEKFIQAGGYKEENWERYWTPEGRKWMKENKPQAPLYWHERQWNCPNAPVVGVSWYEADAFCRWLTEERKDGFVYPRSGRLRQPERVKRKENILGGNVWEWTRSDYHARTERDDFLFDEEIQKLYDTESRDELRKKWQEKNRQLPSLRGGSWYFYRCFAGCAYRYWNYPYVRYFDIGFRCARTSK